MMTKPRRKPTDFGWDTPHLPNRAHPKSAQRAFSKLPRVQRQDPGGALIPEEPGENQLLRNGTRENPQEFEHHPGLLNLVESFGMVMGGVHPPSAEKRSLISQVALKPNFHMPPEVSTRISIGENKSALAAPSQMKVEPFLDFYTGPCPTTSEHFIAKCVPSVEIRAWGSKCTQTKPPMDLRSGLLDRSARTLVPVDTVEQRDHGPSARLVQLDELARVLMPLG